MRSRSPRILYLTAQPPLPVKYGAQIRSLAIARLLRESGEVSLAMLTVEEPDTTALARTREEFVIAGVFPLEFRPIQGLKERLGHELNPWFLNTRGVGVNTATAARIRKLATEYDIVWIHGLTTANKAGIGSMANTVLDVDDLPSQYYHSEFRITSQFMRKAFAARNLWIWKRREAVLLERFNILAVCSEADREYLGADERIHVIPNGYANTAVEPERCTVDPPRIGFIGWMRYAPNREGIEWFIEHVWPLIKAARPDARLRLVGEDSDLGIPGDGIDRLGFVDDAAKEFATWSLSIVPIRVGGGTRIKIAEAFSRKCPVVSTSWGAFGYDVKSGEQLMLADRPDSFAAACLAILQNPAMAQRLAENAWRTYSDHWTWSAIQPRVQAAVDHCLSGNSNPSVSKARWKYATRA